jgi:hypothetical protein
MPLRRVLLYSSIALFLVLDYLSLSEGIRMLEDLRSTGLLSYLLKVLYVLILAAAVFSVKGNILKLGRLNTALLCAIILTSALYFLNLREATHKIHFLQYEILGILVFKSVEIDISSRWKYLISAALLFLVGITEEVTQATFPDRSFDLTDLGIDMSAGIIILAFMAVFVESGWRKQAQENG